ncbi:MAG: hypothetical protein AB9856_20055 [Cellulosilyticaceae bacterium]
MESELRIKKLVYDLYTDILELFKSNPAELMGGMNDRVEYNMQIYFLNQQNHSKIIELSSYKNLISELAALRKETIEQTDKNIGFGIIAYYIKIFLDTLNPLKLEKVLVGYNNKPIEFDRFPFDYKKCIQPLKFATSPSLLNENKRVYYRFIENFDIKADYIILDEHKILRIRKLQEKDRKIYRDDFNYEIGNEIEKCKVVIESDIYELVNDQSIRYIVGLLRIFKSGDFRISLLYNLSEDILGNRKIIRTERVYNINTYNEPQLSYEIPGCTRQYILDESEGDKFKRFYNNNLKYIKQYEFALECLNNISNVKLEFRIPILFMIIESFFEIDREISYKISLFSTKLLKKNKDFMEMIKLFYSLRSKIAHGDKNKINKILENMKSKKYIDEANIEKTYEKLYEIMSEIWKKIMSLDLKNPKELIKEIENQLIENNDEKEVIEI